MDEDEKISLLNTIHRGKLNYFPTANRADHRSSGDAERPNLARVENPSGLGKLRVEAPTLQQSQAFLHLALSLGTQTSQLHVPLSSGYIRAEEGPKRKNLRLFSSVLIFSPAHLIFSPVHLIYSRSSYFLPFISFSPIHLIFSRSSDFLSFI